jgi:hypothetical protein
MSPSPNDARRFQPPAGRFLERRRDILVRDSAFDPHPALPLFLAFGSEKGEGFPTCHHPPLFLAFGSEKEEGFLFDVVELRRSAGGARKG